MAGKLRSGFGEVQKQVEKQKAGFTPPTGKLNFFSMEAGEIVIVRFLDDEIITAKFYEWIINNQGKASGSGTEFICAPDLYQYDPDWKGEDWVQKWTAPTAGIGWAKKFKSDELTLPKLADRTVGIAVKREVDPDNPGQMRDVLEPLEVDGKNHISLHFLLVRQALSNFWDQMVGYHGLYGTICDRDYRIERKGDGLKTTYQAIGLNPDVGWEYGDPANGVPSPSLLKMQAFYGYGVKVSDPESKDFTGNPDGYSWENRYLYCPTTVSEWCERRASEEYAEYWLNPNAAHLSELEKKGAVSADQLLATQRPVDPRQPMTAATATAPATVAPPATVTAPVVSTATGTPAVHQQEVPLPPTTTPAASGIDELHPDTTQNPAPEVPAEPISGDRFEEMRRQMAERQQAQAASK